MVYSVIDVFIWYHSTHYSNIIVNISYVKSTLYFVNYQELVLVLTLIRELQLSVLVLVDPAVAHRHVLNVAMFETEETTETVGQRGDQHPAREPQQDCGGGGGGGGGGGASQENGGHPLPGIGGLFGEGFPKLRSAGQSGAGTSARKPFKVPSSSNQGDKTRNKMFSSKDTSWDQQKSLVYVKSPKMTIVGTIWVLCKHLGLVSSTCNKVGKT